MAMTREQQQALSSGVDSSFEEKLKELEAIKLKIAAEEARIKAELAEAKAVEASASEPTAEQQQAISGMGLTGNRDVDGSLKTEPYSVDISQEQRGIKGTIDLDNEEQKAEFIKQITAKKLKEPTEGNDNYNKKILTDIAKDWSLLEGFEDTTWSDETSQQEGTGETNISYSENSVIKHPWFREVFGDMFDSLLDRALEVPIIGDFPEEEEVDAAEKEWQNYMDIDKNWTTDEKSESKKHMGIDPEQGRNIGKVVDTRGEKAGWAMAEGSNMWSVDEKDDYWKTQEGFDEAMDLYGKKPAWVKEPTLIWNPETQEYEEVEEEEEFEDLSTPTISADIKKLFG